MLPFVCQLVAKKSAFYAEGLNDKIEFCEGDRKTLFRVEFEKGVDYFA